MTKYELKNARKNILYNLLTIKLEEKRTSKDKIIKVLEDLVFDFCEYSTLAFLSETTHKELEEIAEWYENAIGIKE